jgi:HD superfamily phosphohydrolase
VARSLTETSISDIAWFPELAELAETSGLFRTPLTWPTGPKVIHDAVWGTRELDGWEVALLDLPVVQRLRQIHQTSLAFLTFPTALHTRFDHSVGVAVIAKEMLGRLQLTEKEPANAVRAAALLHDIGHGPFSHLTEEAYGILKDPFENVLYVRDDLSMRPLYLGAQPHEALGALLLRTPAAQRFFAEHEAEYGANLDATVLGDIITGKGMTGWTHYSGIVNGPFDADKIDYLHRDSLFSGLPISIDLHRFLYSVDYGRLPDGARILAMTDRGVITTEQILFGKATLFSGIYHHRKVRAADCAYKSVVERLIDSDSTISGISLNTPANFLALTDSDFLTRNPSLDDDVARELLMDIVERRLSVGAVQLDKSSVGPLPEGGMVQADNLWSLLPGGEAQRNLQYTKVREIREEIVDSVSHDGARSLMLGRTWLDIPHVPNLETEPPIVRGRDLVPEFRATFPAEQWADIYRTHKYQGHVFGPRESVSDVERAALKVLTGRFARSFRAGDSGEEE